MTRKKLINTALLVTNFMACVALFMAYRACNVDPVDNAWLPLFGLAYPVILIVNIIFIIIWWYRERRYIFISLISIIIGFSALSDFIQINFYEEPTADEYDFKVMSYNVKLFGFYEKNSEELRAGIFDFIVEEAPNVMCFQEFYHTDFKGGFITRDSLIQIQKAKNYHEKYTHVFRHKQNFGVVTMSEYPIINKGYIPFEGDMNNFCIYSDLLLPSNDTIRVFNAHMASIRFQKEDYKFIEGDNSEQAQSSVWGGTRILQRLQTAFLKRSDQTKVVLEHIKKSPYPTILAGDFNDSPVSYCYNQFRTELNDAFHARGAGIGNTYNGSFPSLRIDYTMYSDELDCKDFDVAKIDYSDHFPVVTKFKLNY